MGNWKFPTIYCDMSQNVSKFDKNAVFDFIPSRELDVQENNFSYCSIVELL